MGGPDTAQQQLRFNQNQLLLQKMYQKAVDTPNYTPSLDDLPDVIVKNDQGQDVTLDIAQKHAIWSPFFAEDPSMLEYLAVAVLAKKLLSTPEGTRVFGNIITSYIAFLGNSLNALHMASSSNWVNGLMSLHFANNVYRRIGLVDHTAWADYASWSAVCFNEIIAKETLYATLTGLGSLSTGIGNMAQGIGGGIGAALKGAGGLGAITSLLGG